MDLSVETKITLKYLTACMESEYQRHMRNGDIDKKTYELACRDLEEAIKELIPPRIKRDAVWDAV